MNYSTLQTDVAAYLHRSDLTARLPQFIDQARVRIGRDMRSTANQKAATVTGFSSGRAAMPDNASILIAVWLDDYELQWVSQTQVAGASSGVYSVDGGDLIVPGADSTTAVSISYWAIPAPLVNPTDVSEGMNEQPDVWRFASVEEGAIFLQDWELAGQMRGLYTEAVRGANKAGRDLRFGKGVAMSDTSAALIAVNPGL